MDGSVALITVGASGSVDTTNIKDPVVVFVLGQKSLMYNLTLYGSKYPKPKKVNFKKDLKLLEVEL